MNEKIKLNKRQPTWNYILNDLALYSLMTKVIHSEEATNQEKFDFMYQIELLQQENKQLKEQLLATQTNEETFRLEMEDITRILGLDEDTIFDDVKTYARSLKENKILRENAEHNDKVVDKVNWENQLLKKENKQLKEEKRKVRDYINKHCVNEKISKEVGYKCYTMADTNELEKIMKILGDK